MEIVFSILPILIFVIVGSVFAHFYFGSQRRTEIEMGNTPLFEEQAGGRFDGFNLTIPFVRHTIYDDFVVISYGRKKHILKIKEINNVSQKKHIFSKGLTYSHNKSGVPVQCVVWSKNGAKVLEILKVKGVPTHDRA